MCHRSRTAVIVGCAALLLAGGAPLAQAAESPPTSTSAAEDHSSMPGMDHGSVPGMQPLATPTASDVRPPGHQGSAEPGGHDSMPGMTHSEDVVSGAVSRPRTAVLGGFAGLNAGVMGAALVIRRRRGERARRWPRRGATAAS